MKACISYYAKLRTQLYTYLCMSRTLCHVHAYTTVYEVTYLRTLLNTKSQSYSLGSRFERRRKDGTSNGL